MEGLGAEVAELRQLVASLSSTLREQQHDIFVLKRQVHRLELELELNTTGGTPSTPRRGSVPGFESFSSVPRSGTSKLPLSSLITFYRLFFPFTKQLEPARRR